VVELVTVDESLDLVLLATSADAEERDLFTEL